MIFPTDFISDIKSDIGDKEAFKLLESLSAESNTSIRLNPKKTINCSLDNQVFWNEHGYYIDKKISFPLDIFWHTGKYYVQEASSMFLEFALKHFFSKEDELVGLDLCAAPGGKSTLTLGFLNEKSLLVSNEIIKSRAHILNENISKWGYANNIITNDSPSSFRKLNNFFDFIIVDAPCSGEGMFRKDIKAIQHWSKENVKLCFNRQREILDDIWDSLKHGGMLFYSTCTFNKMENEEIVQYLVDKHDAIVEIMPINENWGITENCIGDGKVYHFYPSKVKGEGFFFAAIRKKNIDDNFALKRKKTKDNKNNTLNKNEIQVLKSFFKKGDNYEIKLLNNIYYALEKSFIEIFKEISNSVNIISFGVSIGEYKRNTLIPSSSIAFSNEFNEENFQTYKVDYNTALSFFRKESISIPDAPKGLILLQYEKTNIGFVKNLGNRANNLYQTEWRLRNPKNPDEIVKIKGLS